MKRILLLLVISLALASPAAPQPPEIKEAATLKGMRVGIYPQKIRIVFDLDGLAYYGQVTTEGHLNIFLMNAKPAKGMQKILRIDDWAIQGAEAEEYKDGTLIRIPMEHPVPYTVFPLAHPSRLVIDFGRTFTQKSDRTSVSDGIDHFSVVKADGFSYVTAHVLEVDMQKTDVSPALAKLPETLMESVRQFFTPWAKKKRPGFYRQKVSDIVKYNGAAAGINATYFGQRGPLGVLMIDGELISYPIWDRTALIITRDRKAYIDNITLDAYFEAEGAKYSITGINEPRSSQSDIILYNSYWGELSRTNALGYDLAVEKGVITTAREGNIWIPEEGFVLSAGPLYAEMLPQKLKVGDPVRVTVNVIPYSQSVRGELKHLVGGGPRLLRSGMVYISKHEERFRPDIAMGRAARSAVGITKEGKLLFVAVDGRMRRGRGGGGGSVGMTLVELAHFMRSIGAEEALNLDGGGSSTMVANGAVLNTPVDGSERLINNAIVLKPLR